MSSAIFDILYYSKSIYNFLPSCFKNTLSFVRTYIATPTITTRPPSLFGEGEVVLIILMASTFHCIVLDILHPNCKAFDSPRYQPPLHPSYFVLFIAKFDISDGGYMRNMLLLSGLYLFIWANTIHKH